MPTYQKEEPFELPVDYRNQKIILPARLVQAGYSWKIYIQVEGQQIIFEPDEERNFRAVAQANNDISIDFIKAIIETLEAHFR